MAAPQSSTLIQEYSEAFTSLQAGKTELVQWGAGAVQLNRFVVDAANSTGAVDPDAVIHSIDYSRVTHDGNAEEQLGYCRAAVKRLIALQEEVTVLKKSAGEFGISAGLLTIIGQAANQSPDDNGASVLRQLSDLVNDDVSTDKDKDVATEAAINPTVKSDPVATDTLRNEESTNDTPVSYTHLTLPTIYSV